MSKIDKINNDTILFDWVVKTNEIVDATNKSISNITGDESTLTYTTHDGSVGSIDIHYTLPPATDKMLGGIIAGKNITIDEDGNLSLTQKDVESALGYESLGFEGSKGLFDDVQNMFNSQKNVNSGGLTGNILYGMNSAISSDITELKESKYDRFLQKQYVCNSVDEVNKCLSQAYVYNLDQYIVDIKNFITYEYDSTINSWIESTKLPTDILQDGRIYYNEITKKLYYVNGTEFISLSDFISDISNEVSSINIDLSSKIDSLTTKLNTLSSQYTKLATSLSTLTNSHNTLASSVNNSSTGLSAIGSKVTGLEISVNTINGSPRITQQGGNGNYWYRVWSNGWIEQGGRCTKNTKTVSFTKPFINLDYTVILSGEFRGVGGHEWNNAQYLASKAVTGFDIAWFEQNNVVSWYACGY